VKPKVEKITKEVNILIKKAKHIRRYKYTTEQNLEPIEDALEELQETLVAYEEAAKGVKLDWGMRKFKPIDVQGQIAMLLWMFKGHAFVDVYGQIA
jgi:hypothetical protein